VATLRGGADVGKWEKAPAEVSRAASRTLSCISDLLKHLLLSKDLFLYP